MGGANLVDERLRRLLGYWSEKRGSRRAPTRGDLDPLEIPDLLPIVNLIDVLHDPLRFRHRLIGTQVVEVLNRDATGQYVDETLYGSATAEILASLERLTTECRPFRRRSVPSWNGQEWLAHESVELPLVDDDGRVVMILRANSFTRLEEPPPQRLLFEPIELAGSETPGNG